MALSSSCNFFCNTPFNFRSISAKKCVDTRGKILITVLARNFLRSRKRGVGIILRLNCYNVMGSGFNCNFDIIKCYI